MICATAEALWADGRRNRVGRKQRVDIRYAQITRHYSPPSPPLCSPPSLPPMCVSTPVMTKAETSADESRADPGTGEPEGADGIGRRGNVGKGKGTRRAAKSTDYGGPVARRRRADDGEAEQTHRVRRGREQDFAEISRRMYDEIRSSRDPRDHVEDG